MTNNLFVSYRSNTAGRDCSQLINAMESLGACIQVQDLFWYINSDKTVLEAKEVIRAAIDSGDTLIVIDAPNS